MDVPELLTHAARYRALAAGATDAETRVALIELAKEYEASARDQQRRGSQLSQNRG
jgi:hypothetical protein